MTDRDRDTPCSRSLSRGSAGGDDVGDLLSNPSLDNSSIPSYNKDSSALSVNQRDRKTSKQPSVYDMRLYNPEQTLSDEDYIEELNRDNLQICREMESWRREYNLPPSDQEEIERMLSGELDLSIEGLSDTEIKDIKHRLKDINTLPLNELLDYVRLCTFA